MTPFQAFVDPAYHRRGWWRILAGMIVILLFWIAITLLVAGGYAGYLIVKFGDPELGLAELNMLPLGGSPERIIVMILTFTGVWVGVFLALAFFHGQDFWTLFAPNRQRRPAGFVAGVLLALAFALPSIAISMTFALPTRTELPVWEWALWLIPILPLIFVQATGEELIFRGYLLQQLGARVSSPVVWAFLPAFVFGLMHYSPTLENNGGLYYVAITTVMGLTFATLVWRSGSLWTAAGLHVGVNVMGLTVVGAEGILSGAQLWLFAKEDVTNLFLIDLISVIVLFAVVISPLGRVFGDGRRTAGTDAETFA